MARAARKGKVAHSVDDPLSTRIRANLSNYPHIFYEDSVMLGFLAIFGAALAGYAGMPPWVIAASAIALASLSYAEHYRLYRRGQEIGFNDVVDGTMLRSVFHAVVAAGGAYGCGWLYRLL